MRIAASLALPLALCACMVGPDYRRPAAVISDKFKEAPPGWVAATPVDAAPKGAWWAIYNDPVLAALESQVAISNQNVKAFEAQYREAQATVDIARSALFPTLSATGQVTRSFRGAGSSSTTNSFGDAGRASTTYEIEGQLSWDLDVWGRIRRQVESDVAAAQVSAADLANATLSAQATLATDYFELRSQDALARLLSDTVQAFQASLRITQNQYNAGVAASSDVALAQTQLDSARASLIAAGVTRAQFEHAIAVLAGAPPAALTLSPIPLATDVPVPPGQLPSTLLQRRPDIAAAERAMQQQNALIGVQIAAYFPDVSLSGLYGYAGDPLHSLIQAANRVWSLGAAATETLFEGGLRNAEVAAARASYDNAVATYRQTVLSALQGVEDQLSNLRILEMQGAAETQAVRNAQHSVDVAMNAYKAGTQGLHHCGHRTNRAARRPGIRPERAAEPAGRQRDAGAGAGRRLDHSRPAEQGQAAGRAAVPEVLESVR